MKELIVLGLLCMPLSGISLGQTFINMGFEDARIIPIETSPDYPYVVAISNALPGWTVYTYDGADTLMFYDSLSLSTAQVSIHDSNGQSPVLFGRYSLRLQASSPQETVQPTIEQEGTIPPSARSLRFLTDKSYRAIRASFDGNQIDLILLSPPVGSRYVWGGDISSFAGETGKLDLWGNAALDFITFSPEPIPEPSSISLLLFGGIAFGFSRCRRKCD